MSENAKAFSKLVEGALTGDKQKMQDAMDSVKITDADIQKSAHKWALENGFEYDDDSGWYTSKHMPPVDGDHIKGIYGLMLTERSNARLGYIQLLYMVGELKESALKFYSNPFHLVRDQKVYDRK